MLTIPFLLSIILNALIGTIPLLGPMLSGFLVGIIVEKKYPAMVIGFLGAIIGGVFCRIFLLFPDNVWHYNLLYLFGGEFAHYFTKIIQGNPFYFMLYFGFLGIIGGFIGQLVLVKTRN
ncbi:MAG: hypothetical protein ACOC6D_06365 [Atribacterota bacterium]